MDQPANQANPETPDPPLPDPLEEVAARLEALAATMPEITPAMKKAFEERVFTALGLPYNARPQPES